VRTVADAAHGDDELALHRLAAVERAALLTMPSLGRGIRVGRGEVDVLAVVATRVDLRSAVVDAAATSTRRGTTAAAALAAVARGARAARTSRDP
jgi:hypothetical protein